MFSPSQNHANSTVLFLMLRLRSLIVVASLSDSEKDALSIYYFRHTMLPSIVDVLPKLLELPSRYDLSVFVFTYEESSEQNSRPGERFACSRRSRMEYFIRDASTR